MRLRVGYRREKVMIKSVGPGLGPGQAGQSPASTQDQTCTLLNTALKSRRRKQKPASTKEPIPQGRRLRVGSAQEVMIKCGAGSRTRPGGSKTRLHTRPASTPD